MSEPVLAQPPKTKRILELDALRALAAINLLLFHFTLVFPNKYGFNTPLGFDFPYGKYGVQLFFMLSGFVNAMTLLRKQQPGEFIVARFIRILPSYWMVIGLNVVLFSCFSMYSTTVTADATVANLTVMPMLFGYDAWEPVTWTLQVEMLFYFILMTLFVGGALNNTFRTTMILLGISALAVPMVHGWQATAPEAWTTRAASFLSDLFILKYIPLFVTGMLLHEIWAKRSNVYKNLFGILIAAVVFHTIDLRDHNPAVTVILLATLALSAYGKLPVLRSKPLMFISAISYSLYLFHNNLGCLLIRWIHDAGVSPLMSIVIVTILAFILAALLTYWVEQPISRKLKGLWKQFKANRGGKPFADLKTIFDFRTRKGTA